MSDIQECESGQHSVKNVDTSGAVCVSSGSSTVPEAGVIHYAGLAHHR